MMLLFGTAAVWCGLALLVACVAGPALGRNARHYADPATTGDDTLRELDRRLAQILEEGR